MGRMKMRPIFRLITGPAGTGKTSRCIELFRDRILASGGSGLDASSYFVLPNKEHADRIHALLLRDERFRGIAGHHVMPVSDFIRYRAWGGRRVLTQSERSRLSAQILETGGWEWMEASAKTRGMAPLMAGFLREMKSARTAHSAFEREARKRATGPDAKRFRDLARFWGEYEARKAVLGARDAEDAVEDFAAERGAAVDTDLAVFDGFFSLTEMQLAFVEALTRRCSNIVFTLTLETGRREGLFAYPLRLRERLVAMGFVEERFGEMRRTARGGLVRLERAWGGEGAAAADAGSERAAGPSGEADGLEILSAATRRQELEWIARDALTAVREGSRHFSDHMVVVRNLGGYRPWIEEVFGALGVPFDIHERLKVEEHPWARSLAALASVSEGSSGTAVLRTREWAAWIESAAAVADRPAALALAERLRSCPAALPAAEASNEPVLRGIGADGREAELWGQERELIGLLDSADPGVWRAAAMGALARLGVGLAGVEKDGGAERVREVLEELIRRAAAETAGGGGQERRARLIGLIREGLYSVREPSKNRVQFYDVSLALPKEYKVVYVCGLSMGEFPRDHRQHPLLNDADRRELNAAGSRLETAAGRFENERYLFYMTCARASERLVLTRHSLDEDGREKTASPWIEEVRALFAVPPVERRIEPDRTLPDPRAGELCAPREALEALAWLGAQGTDPPAAGALARLWDSWPQKVRAAAGYPGGSDGVREWAASSIRSSRLHGPERIAVWNDPLGTAISASGITALRLCPFRFFSQVVLRLGDPKPSTAMQRGTFLHELLRELLEGFHPSLAAAAEADLRRKAVELFIARAGSAVLTGESRHERQWWTHLWKELFVEAAVREWRVVRSRAPLAPAEYESSFSEVVHTAGGERFRLKGVIDRTDVDAASGAALAVDYKSGSLLPASALGRGRLAQALVYPAALRARGWKPLGIEYVSLKKDERRRIEAGPDGEHAEALDQEWVRVAEALKAIRGGAVEPVPGQESCRDCAYGPVCRKKAEGIFAA
jgi:ATP-dependent helicase/nuclease subunit B